MLHQIFSKILIIPGSFPWYVFLYIASMESLFAILLLVALVIWFVRSRRTKRNSFTTREQQRMTIDDHYNIDRQRKTQELDRLLEKINRNGIDSLSAKEKERLKQLSR
ncbi:hypothetical protein D3C71_186160 [compost metagenome]